MDRVGVVRSRTVRVTGRRVAASFRNFSVTVTTRVALVEKVQYIAGLAIRLVIFSVCNSKKGSSALFTVRGAYDMGQKVCGGV